MHNIKFELNQFLEPRASFRQRFTESLVYYRLTNI